MNAKKLFFILLTGLNVILLSIVLSLMIQQRNILSVKTFPFDVLVSQDALGFDLDKDKIHFGKMMPATSSQRILAVYHNFTGSARVNIYATGAVREDVSISEQSFILAPNVSKDVLVTLTVPSTTEPGIYEGTILVLFEEE